MGKLSSGLTSHTLSSSLEIMGMSFGLEGRETTQLVTRAQFKAYGFMGVISAYGSGNLLICEGLNNNEMLFFQGRPCLFLRDNAK